MRVRTFGILLLVLVGVIPLSSFAYLSIQRSARTAGMEVRSGNARLAGSIARRIAAYVDEERDLLGVIGASVVQARTAAEAHTLLEGYSLSYPHLHDIAVYRKDGALVIGAAHPAAGEHVAAALAGRASHSPVIPAGADTAGAFAHSQIIAVPIAVVGADEGAIVARVDLIDIWKPVNGIRIGRHGFVRLVSFDGILLAHGDPEERRYVFAGDVDKDSAIVAAGLTGHAAANLSGTDSLASLAFVPNRDWMVVVEQPVSEALAATAAMKRDLLWLGGGAVVVIVLLGVLAGGRVVRSLERLRAHTQVLARGELAARMDTRAPLLELGALAGSLNEMAGSIDRLHTEARAKERLQTFARVAAGLAHDLRLPIEAVRGACGEMLSDPRDEATVEAFRWVVDSELPKLKRFVDDLRRLAQDGNVDLEYAEIHPAELAAELAEELGRNPKWSTVTFSTDGHAEPIVADPNLVRRAAFNLSANAADACTENGPGGHVRIEVADGGADALLIRIHDNGPGIDAARLADLLTGDFRSTKRSSGVGLGFGVARHVAQAHGGVIEAASEVGAGTTFTLRLPREPATPAAEVEAQRRVGAPSTTWTH